MADCRKCCSPLDDDGLCTDETCPFSERQQTGGPYCVIRVDFSERIGDSQAHKLADDLVAVADGFGIVTIVDEGSD